MRWLVIASLFFALQASAETVLLLPIQARGKVDTTAVHRVEQELERALNERGATVIGPKAAGKLLGDADAATRKCKEKPACLGALGQKAKAQKTLSGRASSDGRGVVVQFALVASEGGAQVQTASLAFPPGSDVGKIVTEGLSRVVPMEEAEAPALQAVVSIKKKTTMDTSQVDLGPDLAAPVKAPSAMAGRSRAMLYAGIVAGALGVAGFGTGVAFAGMAQSTWAPVTDTTQQVVAEGAHRQATQQLVIGNVGMGVGAGLLGLGAILIVTDIIMHKQAQPKLSVSASGVQGSIEVAF